MEVYFCSISHGRVGGCSSAAGPLFPWDEMAPGWLGLTRVHPHQSPVLLGPKGRCDRSVTAEPLAHGVAQLRALCPDPLWLDVGSSLHCLLPQDNLENYEKCGLRRHLARYCHLTGPLGPSPWPSRNRKGGIFFPSLQEPHARAPSRLPGCWGGHPQIHGENILKVIKPQYICVRIKNISTPGAVCAAGSAGADAIR